jgi:hypothetical protein
VPEDPVANVDPVDKEPPQEKGPEPQTPPDLGENDADALIAEPGEDQSVFVGDTVSLDGSASRAAEGRSLSYSWSFVSKPPESRADLSDPVAVKPVFVADVAGIYMLELVVSDGVYESLPATVVILAEQRRKSVPRLVGLELKNAEALLLAEGLKIGPISTVDDPQTPKNRVVGQQPSAGSPAVENAVVSLVISFPANDEDDQDGLPDAWEYARFGGLQQRGADDADGDGYSNYQEYLVGTDPTNRSEAPVPAGTFFEYDIFGRIVVKQITLEP